MVPPAQLLRLPPNRVWRTYLGGRELDRLAGTPVPRDTHFPEDWIASTTRALNPPDATRHAAATFAEGVSPVCIGADPTLRNFADVLAAAPENYLGAAHVARFGPTPHLYIPKSDHFF
jgi:mannose-6-phosphate isomerase